jgi:glutamate racemase
MTKIAVLDSGIGGTTVLERVRERAPWADLIYVADHAFGPYGERTLEVVRDRTELLGRYLESAGVTEIVIACNSASAAALQKLRDVLPNIAFVGMEPAVKPAAELTKSGTVAVLATSATFQGELFKSLVGRHGTDIDVIEQACPGLAAAVEHGEPVGPLLDNYLPPIAASAADVVVLGCTHYPLIRSEIEARLPGMTVVDPSDAVAKHAVAVAHDIGIDLKGGASTEWWTTDLEIVHLDDRGWQTIDILEGSAAAVRIGSTTITAVQGDLTSMPVEVVVNAANNELAHGGGIALAISDAGGRTIAEESAAWIETYGPLVPGVAALTSSGHMPSSYVAHVSGPIYRSGQENEELLAAAVLAALDTATEIEAISVALPAISAGVYGYPADEAAVVIAEAAASFIDAERTSLRSVRLVGYDRAMTERFAVAISSLL